MVSPVQTGFQQQFSVNRALNTGAAVQANPQQDQQARNPVEDVNNEAGRINQSQQTETSNTRTSNATNNIETVATNRSDATFSSSSSDRGSNLDISV